MHAERNNGSYERSLSDVETPVRPVTARRRALAIFVAALVGVPVVALTLIAYDLADASGGGIFSVALPAVAGVAAGATLFVLLRALDARVDATTRRGSSIGLSLIVVAAVGGTFSSALPRSVVAFVDSAVLGFFLAFDVVLVRLWRRDPAFRNRIKRAWRRK